MTTIDLSEREAQCEYCNKVLHFPFNRIKRHSQPKEQKHKQGNIPTCNECIHSMHSRGDLVIDAHTHRWVFSEDNLSQRKF